MRVWRWHRAGPVTLLSAPGAGLYAGCGWWRAVIARRATDAPDILDCADAPGRALEALSIGCRILVVLPCPAWDAVAERAAARRRAVARTPAGAGPGRPGASRHIAAWLGIG